MRGEVIISESRRKGPSVSLHCFNNDFIDLTESFPMDDLTEALSASFVVSKDNNSTAAPHPRLAQYKCKYSVLEQSERRRHFLDLQKRWEWNLIFIKFTIAILYIVFFLYVLKIIISSSYISVKGWTMSTMLGIWLMGTGLGQTVMGKKTWRNSKRVNRNKMTVQRKKGWKLIGSCQRTTQTRSVLDMFFFLLLFLVLFLYFGSQRALVL